MGKLGKKARKFAKKNLQSVLRQRRKNKAFLSKKKSFSRDDQSPGKDKLDDTLDHSKGRNTDVEDVGDTSLDAVFTKDDSDMFADISDSDGYLSEDSSCPHVVGSEIGKSLEGNKLFSSLSTQNEKIHKDLAMQKKKLNRLRKKDPEFSKFLKNYKGIENSQNGNMYSDEDEESKKVIHLVDNNEAAEDKGKLFTSSAINLWCQLVKEEHSSSAFVCLLNAYRAACHYGAESLVHQIQNSETFCSILMFVLSEADDIFRRQLQISLVNCKKETILELQNTSKWQTIKPFVKSYFRSTLFLLDQVADSDILNFALNRLRASLIFFAVFPSLLHRLIKTTVHLWATGGGILSSTSFQIIRDVAALFSVDYFDTCIAKTFVAYMAQSRVSKILNNRHLLFLANCIVEICSLDVQNSSRKVLDSISQLSRILRWGLQTKKKEVLKKICSWEYANCIDLWVRFISVNIQDHDLQPLLFRIIQLINGVACMFTGPRYLPLRFKCIQWLNNLSTSSGIFIPVASYVLDVLEIDNVKEGGKLGDALDFSTVLRLPKSCLKSKTFQEECLSSAIEQLSFHFSQWSYHISFPELATIPLFYLRKFHDRTSAESLRRTVNRLIDQIEQNVNFVQKRRDEVVFSPKDHQSVETFLQLEKSGKNASFTQYYQSILERAALRSLYKENISSLKQKKSKRKRGQLIENSRDERSGADPALNAAAANGTAGFKGNERRTPKVKRM
ncbi:unnamed protein product [Coffea canephora]|uniref:Nucleolar complex protein 2 homolog n=1 Tax=Coffea canephora TaxID=49390 RepID=A0A068TTY4_COFCA|nr:unnamed protein product [Coffea canephora]